jgi:hypothetical protein
MFRGLVGFLSIVLMCAAGNSSADTPFRLGTVIALTYSEDGRLLAAADMVRKLAVYRADDGSLAPGFEPCELDDRILALRFSPDGTRLVVATSAALHLFEVQSGTDTKTITLSATAAALSADGGLVAFPEGDNVAVLDTSSGKRVGAFPTGLGFPETLAFSPDGHMLAVGAQETIITLGAPAPQGVPSCDLELFELPSGHRKAFKALSAWFSSVGFSADSSGQCNALN